MPSLAGERLLEGAGRLAAVLLVLLELDGDPRSRLAVGVPRPERVEVGRRALVTRRVMASSMARWIVDLPASFGPRTTVTPGARSMSSSR